MRGRRQVHGNEFQLRKYGNMYGGSQGFPQEIRDEEDGRRRYREQQAQYGNQPQVYGDGTEEGYDEEDEHQGQSDEFRGRRNPSPLLHGSGYGSHSRRRSMPEDYQGAYGQAGAMQGGFRGRGPKGYRRSDERIAEEVNDLLTDHDELDAGDIEVTVSDGEVTLAGTVPDRHSKRLAEDLADDVSGVQQVHNQLRINRPQDAGSPGKDNKEHLGRGNGNRNKK